MTELDELAPTAGHEATRHGRSGTTAASAAGPSRTRPWPGPHRPRRSRLELGTPPAGRPAAAWTIVALAAAVAWRADRADLVAAGAGVFLAGLGVVVATGWARQANLGQLGFVGIGAYAAAWLDGWPWLVRVVAAGCAAGAAAVPIGLAASRLRGMALGALTLLGGVTVWSLARTPAVMDRVGGDTATGVVLRPPSWAAADTAYALVAVALSLVGLAAVLGMRRTRSGRAMAALSADQRALVSSGWQPGRLVLAAFVTSAALGGVGGVVMGTGYGSLSVADIDPLRSLVLFAQVMVLGSACTAAPALAAVVLAAFVVWDLPAGWLAIVSGFGLVVSGATMPDGLLVPRRPWRRPGRGA